MLLPTSPVTVAFAVRAAVAFERIENPQMKLTLDASAVNVTVTAAVVPVVDA